MKNRTRSVLSSLLSLSLAWAPLARAEEPPKTTTGTFELGGYGTDVDAPEPMANPHPYDNIDNILVTPHIGSRTFESVERQAMRATLNLVNYLKGESDFIQANKF